MISANFIVDVLRKHEWAQKLPWHQIEMLAKLAEERHFQPGEVLYNQGDIADYFYVIVSGRFTAKAMTPVEALVFNGPKLFAECERDTQFGLVLMKHLLRVVSERLDASRLQLLIRS